MSPLNDVYEDLSFLSRSFPSYSKLLLKIKRELDSIGPPEPSRYPTLSKVVDNLREARKCLSGAKPDKRGECARYLREAYKYAILTRLEAQGKINVIKRMRRALFTGVAIGLPLAGLFGFGFLAVALVFIGTLWTYPYFVNLRKIGWVVAVLNSLVLLPIDVIAVRYSIYAILDPEELARIAEALGMTIPQSAVLVAAIGILGALSASLLLYAMIKLLALRAIYT